MATDESRNDDQCPEAIPLSVGTLIASLVALALILFVAQSALAPPRARARLCNVTGFELSQVNFKGHDFGDLATGALSSAVTFDGLFGEESIVVTMRGNTVKNILEDHVREKPLASGEYTFVLTNDEQAEIRAKLSPSGECPQAPNNAFQLTPTARQN